MAKNRIRITYVDAPFHRETSLYAKYFLYYATGNETFGDAIRFRKLLFDTAAQNIRTEESLRDYTRSQGIVMRKKESEHNH